MKGVILPYTPSEQTHPRACRLYALPQRLCHPPSFVCFRCTPLWSTSRHSGRGHLSALRTRMQGKPCCDWVNLCAVRQGKPLRYQARRKSSRDRLWDLRATVPFHGEHAHVRGRPWVVCGRFTYLLVLGSCRSSSRRFARTPEPRGAPLLHECRPMLEDGLAGSLVAVRSVPCTISQEWARRPSRRPPPRSDEAVRPASCLRAARRRRCLLRRLSHGSCRRHQRPCRSHQ